MSHAEGPTTLRKKRLRQGHELYLGARNTGCWANATDDLGLQFSEDPHHFWMERHILPYAADSPFVPIRGRYCMDDRCMRLEDTDDYHVDDYAFDYSVSTFTLRRPVPCPAGMYCHPGTGVSTTNMKNFSTPQPCFETMYCPEGSEDPQGAGECPPGFYCPFGVKLLCPVGTHCPRDGLYDPLPCPPGTYNPQVGQMSCTECPRGYICPGFGRVSPAICPNGFVCSKLGLRNPNLRCLAGYFCPNGTETVDPFRNDTTLRPYPCSPGTYCLTGAGYKEVLNGNFLYAQSCTAGFFCEAGSNSPRGSGLCPPGFVCPTGTAVPVPTPKGSYAELNGTIVAEKCLPGFYAPTIETTQCYPCPPGTSCEAEGTSVASLCGPGTYHSSDPKDGIPCHTCPEGTWSKQYGLREQGECVKCPTGTVCPVQGMTSPCSHSDLPQPFTPIVLYQGAPAFEYLFESTNRPNYYAQFQCLALNQAWSPSLGLVTDPTSQTYFFGELVPPYIDALGRGPYFRATDPFHTRYQSNAKCYYNPQQFGSRVYQRMADYFGPQYDIQLGTDHQGYAMFNESTGVTYYAGFYGEGSLYIDLPHARKYEPAFNCTRGFALMNASCPELSYIIGNVPYLTEFEIIAITNAHKDPSACGKLLVNGAGQFSFVYTDAVNDPLGQSNRIVQGVDQFYPGTCEADIICYQATPARAATQMISCPEGYLCDETTTTASSGFYYCRAGYVSDFGSTPDPGLFAPAGQFKKLCDPGYICNGKIPARSCVFVKNCPAR
jgi:hypothetical protein